MQEAEANPTAIEEVLQNPASACVEETNIAPSSEPSFVKVCIIYIMPYFSIRIAL